MKFATIFNIFKSIYYEVLSNFVVEKVSYKIVGKCLKCGKCCNYMYSYDTYTEKEFKLLQFFYPPYRRFYIKGRDEFGNLIFACKLVNKDGTCSVYDKRLNLCKKYPRKSLPYKAEMHEGCGYKVDDIKFDDYLN